VELTANYVELLPPLNTILHRYDKQELTQALDIFLNHYAKSANKLATIGSTKSFSMNQNAVRGDLDSGLEDILPRWPFTGAYE
jgi:eukaryotic translation initiation factor 2C